MKKVLLLLILSSCHKNDLVKTKYVVPDITENLSIFITNQKPDSYDTAFNLLSSNLSFSINNAFYDTPKNGIFDTVLYCYGGEIFVNQTNDSATLKNSARLYIGLGDSSNIIVGNLITKFYSSESSGTIGNWLNIWHNEAYYNDSLTYIQGYTTYQQIYEVNDTLTFTSMLHIDGDLLVSGSFSERIFSGLTGIYKGSIYWNAWYMSGTFSNIIWH